MVRLGFMVIIRYWSTVLAFPSQLNGCITMVSRCIVNVVIVHRYIVLHPNVQFHTYSVVLK